MDRFDLAGQPPVGRASSRHGAHLHWPTAEGERRIVEVAKQQITQALEAERMAGTAGVVLPDSGG